MKDKNEVDVPLALRQRWDNYTTHDDREKEKANAPKLLDKLRELGVIQVSHGFQCVLFYTVHNMRPLLMFRMTDSELPQFDRLHPFHVRETVDYLMWERLLEPELALSYKGLFDYMPMIESHFNYLSSIPSDGASDHMCGWFWDEQGEIL